MDISGFVNDQRNKCQFSGYPLGVHDGVLLLRQNHDLARAIPIQVSRRFTPPVPWRPIMVTAHLLAKDGVPYFRYVHHISATIQSMPQRLFWLNSLRGADKHADPFDSMEKIRADIRKAMQVSDEVIDSMLKQVESNSRFRKAFTNTVRLAGFIGPKAFRAPTEEGGQPHVHLLLQQYPELETAIPIDIYGVDASFGSRLRAHLPVTIFAKAQAGTAEGGASTLQIISDWKGVAQAPAAAFAGKHWPQWAIDALRDYHTERVAAASPDPQNPVLQQPVKDPDTDAQSVPVSAPVAAAPGPGTSAPSQPAAPSREAVLAAFADDSDEGAETAEVNEAATGTDA